MDARLRRQFLEPAFVGLVNVWLWSHRHSYACLRTASIGWSYCAKPLS
jgi:hypothetical protein